MVEEVNFCMRHSAAGNLAALKGKRVMMMKNTNVAVYPQNTQVIYS